MCESCGHTEKWAAEQRRLGCPSCCRGDCSRHSVDFEVEGVVLLCRHDCGRSERPGEEVSAA